MTRSTPVHKYKALLGSLLLATVLILSNICTYTVANSKKSPVSNSTRPGYAVVFISRTHPDLGVERYVPSIYGLEDDKLTGKIRENLKAAFFDWLPEKYFHLDPPALGVRLTTDKYLSLRYVYTFTGRLTGHGYICNTFDMSTGEILYLDDIIEVDEELVSMILAEGVIKRGNSRWDEELDVPYPQEDLDKIRSEKVLERLQLCSVPYSEAERPTTKPTFYLTKNRLYLLNIFNEDSSFYIEQDKISHKLKVEPW